MLFCVAVICGIGVVSLILLFWSMLVIAKRSDQRLKLMERSATYDSSTLEDYRKDLDRNGISTKA